MPMSRPLFTLTAALLFVAGSAVAQATAPAPAVLVSGDTRIELTQESLAGVPPAEATASYLSSKGYVAAHYKGVLLWDLLRETGVIGEDVKPVLRNVLVVSAEDGHEVAFSTGEIAPDFGNRPVLLAWEKDGAATDGGMMIVVPGDTRGARFVKGVTGLDYR